MVCSREQADLTGITAAITIIADGQSTIYLMMGEAPLVARTEKEARPLTEPDAGVANMLVRQESRNYVLKSL